VTGVGEDVNTACGVKISRQKRSSLRVGNLWVAVAEEQEDRMVTERREGSREITFGHWRHPGQLGLAAHPVTQGEGRRLRDDRSELLWDTRGSEHHRPRSV
jgi:hypothetical protein